MILLCRASLWHSGEKSDAACPLEKGSIFYDKLRFAQVINQTRPIL